MPVVRCSKRLCNLPNLYLKNFFLNVVPIVEEWSESMKSVSVDGDNFPLFLVQR